MPRYKEIAISKSVMPSLPEGYEESRLGASDGALIQYRGRSGVHVREYKDHFLVHSDRFDPRKNPLLHVVVDSPETLLALGSAAVISKVASKCSSSGKSKAAPFGMNPLLFLFAFISLDSVFRSLKRALFG